MTRSQDILHVFLLIYTPKAWSARYYTGSTQTVKDLHPLEPWDLVYCNFPGFDQYFFLKLPPHQQIQRPGKNTTTTTTTTTTRIEDIQPLSPSPKQMTTKIHPQSLTASIPEHGWLEEDLASFWEGFFFPKDPLYVLRVRDFPYNPMTWGWDWDHQSYEFSGGVGGFLGFQRLC